MHMRFIALIILISILVVTSFSISLADNKGSLETFNILLQESPVSGSQMSDGTPTVMYSFKGEPLIICRGTTEDGQAGALAYIMDSQEDLALSVGRFVLLWDRFVNVWGWDTFVLKDFTNEDSGNIIVVDTLEEANQYFDYLVKTYPEYDFSSLKELLTQK